MSANVRPKTAARVIPRRRVWLGRGMTGLTAAFLAFDAFLKLSGHPAVAAASAALGLPLELQPRLGALLAACLALHLVPRRATAVAGAVLLTGYLGGAVLTHLRVGNPLLSHTFVPLYVGAFLWGGLLLRDARFTSLLVGDEQAR